MAARSSLPKPDISENPALAGGHVSISNEPIEVIRKRPDFLAANRGKRFVTPSFVLLTYKRRDGHSSPSATIRYGITVTKKVGNAVARNRIKRRFRALLAEILPQYGIAGVDHIMIGRKEDEEQDFAAMKADLEKGLKHLAKKL